jgi:hypothetical protein
MRRQSVAEAGDHLLLGDGAPNSDAKLLAICADAVEARNAKDRAMRAFRALRLVPSDTFKWEDADESAKQAFIAASGKYQSLLIRAAKLQATTGAGIFAKALACHESATGAPALAKSLAADLLNSPALRSVIWPARPDTANMSPT